MGVIYFKKGYEESKYKYKSIEGLAFLQEWTNYYFNFSDKKKL